MLSINIRSFGKVGCNWCGKIVEVVHVYFIYFMDLKKKKLLYTDASIFTLLCLGLFFVLLKTNGKISAFS